MNFNIFISILFALSLFSQNLFAKDEPKILKDLNSSKSFSVDEVLTKGTLAVLFQPRCGPCKKQIKRLECLKDTVDKIVLIGSFKSERKVLRSYLKKKTKFKGYYISKDKYQSLGFEEEVTPQSIYFNPKNEVHIIGYKTCEDIKSEILNTAKATES
jgi:hypothetical protein